LDRKTNRDVKGTKRHCHDERKTPEHVEERTTSYVIALAVSGSLSQCRGPKLDPHADFLEAGSVSNEGV
jgi:hypothetical protein